MSFRHSGWGGKRVEVDRDSALLWCWAIMSTAIVYGYMDHYDGNCVIVIADQTATVQAETMARILKVDEPGSPWKMTFTKEASSVGRPCDLTVFTKAAN